MMMNRERTAHNPKTISGKAAASDAANHSRTVQLGILMSRSQLDARVVARVQVTTLDGSRIGYPETRTS
jgi:hypothetical protein